VEHEADVTAQDSEAVSKAASFRSGRSYKVSRAEGSRLDYSG